MGLQYLKAATGVFKFQTHGSMRNFYTYFAKNMLVSFDLAFRVMTLNVWVSRYPGVSFALRSSPTAPNPAVLEMRVEPSTC